MVISDKNKDGKADGERRALIEGLDRPYGLAFWKDYLYVAEAMSIKRYPFDKSATSAGQGQEMVSLAGFDKGHWTRSIAFSPKGDKMYSGSDPGRTLRQTVDERRATILECNPDGSNCTIFAAGIRNPTQINFRPGSNDFWASVQERDGLGDDLVPDFLIKVSAAVFTAGRGRITARMKIRATPGKSPTGEEDHRARSLARGSHRGHRLEVLYGQSVPETVIAAVRSLHSVDRPIARSGWATRSVSCRSTRAESPVLRSKSF